MVLSILRDSTEPLVLKATSECVFAEVARTDREQNAAMAPLLSHRQQTESYSIKCL